MYDQCVTSGAITAAAGFRFDITSPLVCTEGMVGYAAQDFFFEDVRLRTKKLFVWRDDDL